MIFILFDISKFFFSNINLLTLQLKYFKIILHILLHKIKNIFILYFIYNVKNSRLPFYNDRFQIYLDG